MQKNINIPSIWSLIRHILGLSGLMLLVIGIAGCGSSLPDLEIEAEHSCDESRYFSVTNLDTSDTSLKGWLVVSDDGTFVPPDITLAPGGTLNIWSGDGHNDATNISIGRAEETWDLARESLHFERPSSPWSSVYIQFIGCHVEAPQ
ncbi:MAG: lamin tail domain-containing protein [Chloroflexaceae bacterium]|nr:lamin tail domain-containing protein [Chloroflexaceae bacterium]